MDICNVCGGKNECIGCDGIPFSGLKPDECGQCLSETNEKRNNCTRFIFHNDLRIYLLTKWNSNSFCYHFQSVQTLNKGVSTKCQVRDEVSNSVEMSYFIENTPIRYIIYYFNYKFSSKVFRGCPSFPSEMYFWPSSNGTIKCHVFNRSPPYEELLSVERSFTFIQVDFSKNYVAKITPTAVYTNKSIELIAEVKNISSTSFKCVYVSSSSDFFISSENSALTELSSVRCHLPQIPICQDYKLILVDESWTDDDVPPSSIIEAMWQNTVQAFRVKAPAPNVLKALVSDDLREIQIHFKVNIVVTKHCSALFTPESLKQLGFTDFSCWNSVNALFLYLQSTVKLSLNMTLTFAHHNGIRTFCSQDSFSDEVEGLIHVNFPERMIKPKFFLHGPQHVCTGVVRLRISQIIGGGAFGLKYSWSVTSKPAMNLSAIHDFLHHKTNFVEIPVEMLQPGVRYVISVFGENILGVTSDTYYHTVVRKDFQQLAVSVAGLVEVDPVQNNIYIAEVDPCHEHIFPISFYWHVNSSDFFLPSNRGPVLRIPKYTMKRNKFYELAVTVIPVTLCPKDAARASHKCCVMVTVVA
ncbi:uncharacterized protein LOC111089085 [Limulus polyphemus]|uniref:Uncharacterized protein LOC111089085 n=1 Tax=Limulus polyphemus TaxID=6850 RepID=A0ABM1TL17_LIMPO|nr:uncharacterized protein LOC111089085 [Limulus polyphemus]